MALIKEDGTNVADANTYADASDLQAYAALRGITLTGFDETAQEAALIKAMDYLQTFRDQWKGSRTYTSQRLQWPRAIVYIDGYLVEDTAMPEELINAQCELAIVSRTVELMPTRAGGQFKISEKIGPIETKWSEGQGTMLSPMLTRADVFLRPLLRDMVGVLTNYRG